MGMEYTANMAEQERRRSHEQLLRDLRDMQKTLPQSVELPVPVSLTVDADLVKVSSPMGGVDIDRVHSRENILRRAEKVVFGGKADLYGKPERNMRDIATGWSVILGVTVEEWQVALCQDWLKTCRLVQKPDHDDSWLDKAGYSALGHEVAVGGNT